MVPDQMPCTGCEDSSRPHLHCPLCDNYSLTKTHDNACPLRQKGGK